MYLLKKKIKRNILFGLCGIFLHSAVMAQGLVSDKQFWNDVLNDRSSAIKRQLHSGVDPNIKSEEGEPAIMWAIQNQSWGVYDLLVQTSSFDPNITNENNETPLMYLAILGELEKGKDLYAKGARINRLGWTPLHYAASKGQVEFAEWLLDEGAFVHAPAPDGTTPLMMAAFSGNKKMVDLLLDAGADLNAVNLNHNTAVDWANSAKHNAIARYLTELQDKTAHSEQLEERTLDTPAEEKNQQEVDSGGTSKYFDLNRFD